MCFLLGRHYTKKSFAIIQAQTIPPGTKHSLVPPLIFKKAVDHTCSRSIRGCGIHSEGNDTECVICCWGAVTLRFYGNTPPGVSVTLLSFLSLPAIFWDSLGPVQRGERCELYKRSQKTVANLSGFKSFMYVSDIILYGCVFLLLSTQLLRLTWRIWGCFHVVQHPRKI